MAAIQGDWYASRSTHDGEAYPQNDDTVRFVYATQPDGEKYIVAKVWSGDDGDYASTARLVAAAPELLEALKVAANAIDYGQAQVDSEEDRHKLCKWLVQVKRVIAKAEGGGVMGAEFNYRHYRDSDKAKVQEQWRRDADNDLYENGRSYSGSIGMLGGDIDWRPEKFGTADEAEAFLAETHEKWEPPLAVELEGGGWVVGGWCSS